ncbi:MAG: hypothetical protein PF503_25080 [Desulfobacula sp.]|jgi:hypothetical protein|nr:hypothetical protein [Desulfobacula sp.]
MNLIELKQMADQETKTDDARTEFLYKKICAFRQEDLITVSTKELKEYLVLCIKGSAKTVDPIVLLSDPKKHEDFIKVAQKGFHEFNTKIPNANNDGLPLFRTLTEPACQPFVSSRTVFTRKKYGSVDNARISFAQKILSHQFILDEEFKCIGVELTYDSLVRQELIKMGLPEKVALKIGDIILSNMSTPNKNPVHRFSKQIFFPCGDGEYIVISPVQHTGFSNEFHQRMFQITSVSDKFIKFRNTQVAGANPINAGLLNSELGGRHRHLLSLPPKKGSLQALERDLSFMTKNKTIFPDNLEGADLSVFKKIEKSRSNNRKIRATRQREIWKIVNNLTYNARFIAQHIFEIEDRNKTFLAIPDIERKLVDAKYRGKKLSVAEIDTLVDINMASLKLHHQEMLNEKVETLFKDTFKLAFKKGL